MRPSTTGARAGDVASDSRFQLTDLELRLCHSATGRATDGVR